MSLLYATHGLLMQGGRPSTLLNGLVSYWKLDEFSGAVIDSVGLNNGINNGATQGASGKIGTAYSFNGTTDYINIDTAVDDLSSTTTGTMECLGETSRCYSFRFINYHFGDTDDKCIILMLYVA